MACFHPNGMTYNDGAVGKFIGKLTPERIAAFESNPGCTVVPIPCGKCVGCRLDRSKAWADRMLLEFASCGKKALFLTMTYDEPHCPIIWDKEGAPLRTLRPEDTQLFMKRLRKFLDPVKVRYYLAGEYGDTTFRPHYHMILFGVDERSFPDAFVYSQKGETGDVLLESPRLDEIWNNGAVRFSSANYSTFCYVGRYVIKKQFISDGGESFYKGRVPPFSRMSNRPAIGSYYFDPENIQSTQVSLSDGVKVHQISIPRAILEKIQLTDPELYDSIKAQRRYLSGERTKLIEDQLEKPYLEILSDEERRYKEKRKSILINRRL